MPTNRTQAARLLTRAELDLFDASAPARARALTPAQLKAKVERARALRDKARDQFRRQRLGSRAATGSKSGTSGLANQRTRDKAQVLDEVLERLQAALAKAGAAKTTAKKTTAKKTTAKKTTAKKTTAKKTTAKKTTAKKATAKKATAKKATAKNATAKKATAKKATAKKATAKNATAKKTTAKKATVKKATAEKATTRRATAGKRTAATTTAKKAAARKPVAATAAQSAPAGSPRGLFGVPGLSPKAPVPIEPPGTSRSSKAHTGFVSDEARIAAQDRHFAEAGSKAILGHVGAANRRNQAKRDRR